MLDFEEKALCRKAAGILELSVKKGYDHHSFSKLWLKSKTADNLYHWDINDIAQSKQYLLHSVEIEYHLDNKYQKIYDTYIADVMYWFGYITMYLSLSNHQSPSEICEMYDAERIIQSYDTLHTLSSEVAVDKIKNDFVVTTSL